MFSCIMASALPKQFPVPKSCGECLGVAQEGLTEVLQGSGHPLSPPQIGHRDFDVEKRLRRDLRRTRALLADVQLLLAAPEEPRASAQELERLRKQVGGLGRAGISVAIRASPCASAQGKRQEIVANLPVLAVCEQPGARRASCAAAGLPARSTSR